jgi:hypothetical protein
MAFDSGGAFGGAASGAAAGTAVAPGWGTAIGAGVGAITGGLFGGHKSYQSPHFSDIDLQRENPELWAQLQSLGAMADHAEALYNQKVQNDAIDQARQVGQGVASVNDRLAHSGLLGTSAGLSNASDSESRLRTAIAQKAYMEQQQALQQAQSLRSNYLNQYSAAQQGAMAPLQQQAQINFQNDNANSAARNQFISGGLSALGNAYGQYNNQQNMNAQRADDRAFYSTLYGGGTAAPAYGAPASYGVTSYSGVPSSSVYYPGGSGYPSYGGE